jgi:hypothetical protein
MRPVAGIAVLAVAATVCLSASEAEDSPVPEVAQRFLDRQETSLVSYRAVRRLTASNEQRGMSGWIEAVTELHPVSGLLYQITAEGGSGYIRTHVLKKVLVAEQRAVTARERAAAMLTPENYVFGDPAHSEDGRVLVPIVPRRRGEMLVNGQIVLGPDADLIRIEGRLSKNPSFWTRRVEIVRRYGRANGVRVPLEMASKAHLLIFGVSAFTMCIEYESINGEPVQPARLELAEPLTNCAYASKN